DDWWKKGVGCESGKGGSGARGGAWRVLIRSSRRRGRAGSVALRGQASWRLQIDALPKLGFCRGALLNRELALVEASIRLVGASATASSCAQMPDDDPTGPDRFNLRHQVPRPPRGQ